MRIIILSTCVFGGVSPLAVSAAKDYYAAVQMIACGNDRGAEVDDDSESDGLAQLGSKDGSKSGGQEGDQSGNNSESDADESLPPDDSAKPIVDTSPLVGANPTVASSITSDAKNNIEGASAKSESAKSNIDNTKTEETKSNIDNTKTEGERKTTGDAPKGNGTSVKSEGAQTKIEHINISSNVSNKITDVSSNTNISNNRDGSRYLKANIVPPSRKKSFEELARISANEKHWNRIVNYVNYILSLNSKKPGFNDSTQQNFQVSRRQLVKCLLEYRSFLSCNDFDSLRKIKQRLGQFCQNNKSVLILFDRMPLERLGIRGVRSCVPVEDPLPLKAFKPGVRDVQSKTTDYKEIRYGHVEDE
ncbi:MAG: hypothetical protein LBQ43_02660 [Holosporales bacterium]|nr:hypothetical protein [Holosporales bacterium]